MLHAALSGVRRVSGADRRRNVTGHGNVLRPRLTNNLRVRRRGQEVMDLDEMNTRRRQILDSLPSCGGIRYDPAKFKPEVSRAVEYGPGKPSPGQQRPISSG